MNCPACKSKDTFHIGMKGETPYHACKDCGSVFCEELEQGGMIGGGYYQERAQQNPGRIERFKNLCGSDFTLVDFGCGNGELVRDSYAAGIHALGYDRYSDKFKKLPNVQADIISMVEVIEHLTGAHLTRAIKSINKLSKLGTYLYIETCFSDVCGFESTYCEPKVGHCTIWSYHGMDTFMIRNGWKLNQAINSTVRVYEKVHQDLPG